jgi:putative drug exporter of the RND superfamily
VIPEQRRPRLRWGRRRAEPPPELPAGPIARAYGQIVLWLAPLLVVLVGTAAYAAYHFLPSISSAPTATTTSLLPKHPAALAVENESERLFGAPVGTPYVVVQRNAGGLTGTVQRQSVMKAVRVDEGKGPADLRGTFAIPVLNTFGIVPGAREHGTTIVTYLYFPHDTSSGTCLADSQAYARYLGPRLDVVGQTGAVAARVAQYRSSRSSPRAWPSSSRSTCSAGSRRTRP